ncbi:hypothetical protein P3H80_30155 [Mycolicibacterium septicum]|nr:hypothetical protein [Mycolicibacterium septicum]MDF3341718.1 hypothetical protein [Mycolicibacterium septicum]
MSVRVRLGALVKVQGSVVFWRTAKRTRNQIEPPDNNVPGHDT